MDILEELKKKNKNKISRGDIERLLDSIGKPGEKHQEKLDAIRELGILNPQGVLAEQTLSSYKGF